MNTRPNSILTLGSLSIMAVVAAIILPTWSMSKASTAASTCELTSSIYCVCLTRIASTTSDSPVIPANWSFSRTWYAASRVWAWPICLTASPAAIALSPLSTESLPSSAPVRPRWPPEPVGPATPAIIG